MVQLVIMVFVASQILPVEKCAVTWMKHFGGIKNGKDVYYVNS